jgi:hypothetical protein
MRQECTSQFCTWPRSVEQLHNIRPPSLPGRDIRMFLQTIHMPALVCQCWLVCRRILKWLRITSASRRISGITSVSPRLLFMIRLRRYAAMKSVDVHRSSHPTRINSAIDLDRIGIINNMQAVTSLGFCAEHSKSSLEVVCWAVTGGPNSPTTHKVTQNIFCNDSLLCPEIPVELATYPAFR